MVRSDRQAISAGQLKKFFTDYCGDIIHPDETQDAPVFLPTLLAQECTKLNRKSGFKLEWEPNLHAVSEFFIKPHTLADTGDTMSYAEKLNPEGLDMEYYVAHHCGEDFAEFTQCIVWHAISTQKSLKSAYWVSAFALDQHKPLLGSTMEESHFHQALASERNKYLILSVSPTATCLFRVWCAYEILLAHMHGKDVRVCTCRGVLNEEWWSSPEKDQCITHMNTCLHLVEFDYCEAAEDSDRKRIETAVSSYVGDGRFDGLLGADALNAVVRSKLADQAIFTLIRLGDASGVRQALSLKASANSQAPRGIRPLTLAKGCKNQKKEHEEIVKMLQDHGANDMAMKSAEHAIKMWDSDNRVRATALKKLREADSNVTKFHQRSYDMALQNHKLLCMDLHRASQHYSEKGLNLCYAPTWFHLREAQDVIKALSRPDADEQWILNKAVLEEGAHYIDPPVGDDQKTLIVFVSDFEPDDIMAIAQIWQLHRKNHSGMPLICMAADLERDCPPIYEMKALIAVLMLGITKWNVCLAQTDDSNIVQPKGPPNPKAASMTAHHHAGLDNICKQLANFKGEHIKLFLMAPCRGNLNAIVKTLQEMGSWPLRAKWSVRLYSGKYNMKGMTEGDIRALHEVMKHSDTPMVDMAKYVCFGGSMSHSCTSNFTTFVLPSLASALNTWSPLLAAALKVFTNRFNSKLIQPKPGLFQCKKSLEEKLTPEEIERFDLFRGKHDTDNFQSTEEYAKHLVGDAGLFAKVANFKKSTLFAIANKKDDSPLCDQLLFLYEWHRWESQNFFTAEEGAWEYNAEQGYTTVSKDGEGLEDGTRFRAVQPVMEDPFDEDTLDLMRQKLQEFLLNHLGQLYAPEPAEPDGGA